MKKILLKISIAMVLLFVSCQSFAILHLVLTQGVDSAIPIGIINFGQSAADPNNQINQVIAQDLYNSGRFKQALSNDAVKNSLHNPSQVDYTFWRKQSADYLVIGDVQNVGSQIKISYSLIDVYMQDAKGANPEQSSQAHILLQQSFTVPSNQTRGVAHQISDAIYQKILGERGIFSTKIAYVLAQQQNGQPNYKLMIADYDGFNPQAILVSKQPIMSPAWSPDGKKIAYVSFEKRLSAIYVSTIATGQRQLITNISGINGAPDFSPDGKSLAVVLSKLEQPNIYLVNLSNGQLRQITRGYAITTEPSFMPDGKSVLVTSDRGGSPQIYQVDLSNGAMNRLTYNGNYNAQADALPNGQQFVLLHRGSDTDNHFGIAIQDVASGTLRVLSEDDDQSPGVSPNGSMIIYAVVKKQGNTSLAMVSSDGKVHINIPSEEGSVREPAWSPFLTAS